MEYCAALFFAEDIEALPLVICTFTVIANIEHFQWLSKRDIQSVSFKDHAFSPPKKRRL
ncbi:hypothetical protein THF5H11_140011 [Vibrio jasicida]|nr:hypothetical protein THF5H11_140011 [Vibrio jasicida]